MEAAVCAAAFAAPLAITGQAIAPVCGDEARPLHQAQPGGVFMGLNVGTFASVEKHTSKARSQGGA